MRKKYRKQDNKIILSGLILAAVVIVLGILCYRFLGPYLEGLSNKTQNQVSGAELSEEMRYELAHATTAAPGPFTITLAPHESEHTEQTEQTEQKTKVITVMPETQHDMVLTPTMDPNEYWAQQAQQTQETPNGEIKAHMASAFDAEASGLSKLSVSSAVASSVLEQEGYDNSAAMAFDGDSTTSWQEGVDGNGKGEILKALFSGTVKISYITFRVGNWRNYEMWSENSRPRTITVWIGNSGYKAEFADVMTEYCLAFSKEVTTSDVSFEIEKVFSGSDSESSDTCISEITFYGSR